MFYVFGEVRCAEEICVVSFLADLVLLLKIFCWVVIGKWLVGNMKRETLINIEDKLMAATGEVDGGKRKK